MSAESTAPDLVELMRRSVEAANRRDFDAMASFYALDAVWDMSPLGLGVYEGRAAIRRFFEDWFDSYEEWAMEIETIFDLGSGEELAALGPAADSARAAGARPGLGFGRRFPRDL